VIDPHGEYGSAVGQYGRVFRVKADTAKGEWPLYVPFWALPFEELQAIALGSMQPASEASVRDEVTARRRAGAKHLTKQPPDTAITADSPIPFSLKKLWFDLDDYERQTFDDSERTKPCDKIKNGDAEQLVSNLYPAPQPGSKKPFAHPRPRNIAKQLKRVGITEADYESV
jgi:hypothetical protein